MAAEKILSFKVDGMCCAPCTPFHRNGDVNLAMIGPYIDHLVEYEIPYVFVNGSTGEGISMTVDERKRAAEVWVREARGRLKGVIVHVGAGNMRDSMELAQHAESIAADAIACVGPTYFKPATVEDNVAYMKQVAGAASNTPFYLYDIDIVTGIFLDCSEFFRQGLPQIPTLRGVKHTSPSFPSMQNVLREYGNKVDLLLGNEETYLAGLAIGVRVTVCNSFMGIVLKRIRTAFDSGDMDTARLWQNRILSVGKFRAKYGFAPACSSRAFVRALGVDLGEPRLPLTAMPDGVIDNLRQDLASVDFFQWTK